MKGSRDLDEVTYHERNDASLEEAVYEIGVELDSGGVYGVVTAAEGDDARPGDAEAVGLARRELARSRACTIERTHGMRQGGRGPPSIACTSR